MCVGAKVCVVLRLCVGVCVFVLVTVCVVCANSLRSVPQDNWSSTASSGKANDWRTRERVVLDLFSN